MAVPVLDRVRREVPRYMEAPWDVTIRPGEEPGMVLQEEGVRAVRNLMWKELATTQSDESVWLLAAGWKAAEQLKTDQQEVA